MSNTPSRSSIWTSKAVPVLIGASSLAVLGSSYFGTSPLKLFAVGSGVVSAMQFGLWLYEEEQKDATIVDVGWSFGLGVLGLLYAIKAPGDINRRILVGSMAGLWSARLTSHLARTRLFHKDEHGNTIEDGRYQTLRKNWGKASSRNFFVFFQVQALFDIIFSIPFIVCASDPTPITLGWSTLAAVAIHLISVIGEAAADSQLDQYKKNPNNKGKTCQVGLWRFSRHPNYFFEWLHWCSYVFLAIGSDRWWLTLVPPSFLLFLILKVTGIPPTEKQALATKPDYAEYQKTTSAFIPWFPKKKQN